MLLSAMANTSRLSISDATLWNSKLSLQKTLYMRKILLLVVLFGLTQIGCKKPNADSVPTSLNGKWRMIIVKDNATGLTTTKPSSIQGDVEITFTSISTTNGTFMGNTPTNEIAQNDYSIGPNQSLTIPNLGMTKMGETSWGNEFVNNIRSSKEYSFEVGGIVNIKTENKTLTFQKQ